MMSERRRRRFQCWPIRDERLQAGLGNVLTVERYPPRA
jgi:hypothetical protein